MVLPPARVAVLVGVLAIFALSVAGPAAAMPGACKVHEAGAECPGLSTPWARQVEADKPRPEYPRPQLVRRDWQSLNGKWQFAFDDRARGVRQKWHKGRRQLDSRIVVPFTFESPLSGIGLGDTQVVHERVWYRRGFDVPRKWSDRRIRLNFGAVDWHARVWVNGKYVGRHQGGYAPFSFDVTRALRPRGRQIVVVEAYDPVYPRLGAIGPRGKQTRGTTPRHRWFARATGIWQSVWLEPVRDTRVTDLRLTPDPGARVLHVGAQVAKGRGARVSATVELGGRVVGRSQARVAGGSATLAVPVSDVRLWSPESPTLYNVRVQVHAGGRTVDRLRSYTGFRTVSVQGNRIALNGRPYFLVGALDHGYWPDGVYTAPTDDAYRADVELAKSFGLNTLRKHVKVEDPRFYYWADRLGLLVVQDMPSSFNLKTERARDNFAAEWQDMIRNLRDRPSVAFFVGFNEDWGRPGGVFQDEIVAMARALDPTRPVEDASDSERRPVSDIVDIHAYDSKPADQLDPKETRPQWISEFGGLEVAVPGRLWTPVPPNGNDTEDLRRVYGELVDHILSVDYVSGYAWTQFYDTEREFNGFATYDRVPKLPPEEIARINAESLAGW